MYLPFSATMFKVFFSIQILSKIKKKKKTLYLPFKQQHRIRIPPNPPWALRLYTFVFNNNHR